MMRKPQNQTEHLDALAEGQALDDALTTYLKQMGSIPMLRSEQELRLVRRLDSARRRYRRGVLGTWYVLGRLIDTFECIPAGQALERQIDVVPGLGLTADAIRVRLAKSLSRLRRLLTQAGPLFARLWRADGDAALNLRRMLRQRLRKALRLAEGLSPRTELLDAWAAELTKEAESLAELNQPAGRSAVERAERSKRMKELRHRLGKLMITPEELERHLEVVGRRRKIYLQLRRQLAEANLRLVIAIAKRYRGLGLAFADLIQEGNSGLLRAVDKYDHRLGFKFGTYATWWIRQGVTRALSDHSRTVRVPSHLVRMFREIDRAQQELALALGRDPSTAEIAKATNLNPDEVRALLISARAPASLQEMLGYDDEQSLADFLTDERHEDPAETADSHLLKDRLDQALRTLPARDREVIELRFGLKDGRARSLEEVSQLFGITRERIRQIESRGLDRLRDTDRDHSLAAFIQA